MPKLRFWEWVAITGFILGLIAIFIFSLSTTKTAMIFSALALIGMAAWLGGSLIGFLFGVPRFQNESEQRTANSVYIPNTNLEQISDWLTKIIIGATLVQIRDIGRGIGDLSIYIGGSLDVVGGSIVAGGILIFYFVTGFTWGYLWCSLRIFREMAELTKEISHA